MNKVAEINKPEKLKEFQEFVNSFGTTFNGKGGCSNYAKLTGFDKSTISKYINDKEKIHDVHFFIMRLVNDREQAKKELRNLQKQMRNRQD